MKETDRQPPLGDHWREFFEKRGLRSPAGFDPAQFGTEAGKQCEAFFIAQVAFVGEVVGCAREAINKLDRSAQVRRQQHGRNGKIFVVVDSHAGGRETTGITTA